MSSFFFTEVTEFKVRENLVSLSGDSFSIKNAATDETAFSVDGTLISPVESKKLLDAEGNPLYKMMEQVVSVRDKMYITDLRINKTVPTIRRKNVVSLPKGTIQIWEGPSDDGGPGFEISGSIVRKDFTIEDNQTAVKPPWSVRSYWT